MEKMQEIATLKERAQRYQKDLEDKEQQIENMRRAVQELEESQPTSIASPPTSQTFETDGPTLPASDQSSPPPALPSPSTTPLDTLGENPFANDATEALGRPIDVNSVRKPRPPRQACSVDEHGERQCNMSAMCLLM